MIPAACCNSNRVSGRRYTVVDFQPMERLLLGDGGRPIWPVVSTAAAFAERCSRICVKSMVVGV